MGVVMIEIFADSGFEFRDTREHAATDAITSDQAEEAFDLVEPGRRGGREMHVETGMLGQPSLDRRVFMGRVVIRDQMQVEAFGCAAVDEPQELKPFLVTMALHAFADHFACGDIIILNVPQADQSELTRLYRARS